MSTKHCSCPYDLFILKHELIGALHGPCESPIPFKNFAELKSEDKLKVLNYILKHECSRPPQDTWGSATEKLYEVLWYDLMAGHGEYFRKHKYLPIEYDISTNKFSVVIPGAGRPPTNSPMEKPLGIRIDESTLYRLDNYCHTNKIKRSEAVRQALSMLLPLE